MIHEAPLPSAPGFPDVRFVALAPTRVLAVDGTGMPEPTRPEATTSSATSSGTSSPIDPQADFQAAIRTLYPIAYTIHFALKRRGVHAPVSAIEALWDIAPGTTPLAVTWTALMSMPPEASDDEISAAIEDVWRKKAPPAIDRVALVRFDEGLCAEIVHVGPYDAETPTIERLHAAIAAAGCTMRGRHHEIYVSDPRRTAASTLRTIIRQPVDDAERPRAPPLAWHPPDGPISHPPGQPTAPLARAGGAQEGST